MEHLLKVYLLFFYITYFITTFFIPSYRVWKSTKINPVTFSSTDNAHNYIGKIMKYLLAILFMVVVIYCFSEKLYQFFIPIPKIIHPDIQIVGLIVIHVSLIWIIIAQIQMGKSWRIGIDEAHKTELITDGVFKISRNPIFLGLITTTFGLFLVIPNALTFCITILSYVVIQIQIRLEEEFLLKTHTTQYQQYSTRVRRLI